VRAQAQRGSVVTRQGGGCDQLERYTDEKLNNELMSSKVVDDSDA
jgi:hypothetical protein